MTTESKGCIIHVISSIFVIFPNHFCIYIYVGSGILLCDIVFDTSIIIFINNMKSYNYIYIYMNIKSVNKYLDSWVWVGFDIFVFSHFPGGFDSHGCSPSRFGCSGDEG